MSTKTDAETITCTLVGTNRRTATHPPCPNCGTPLNPTHWCGKPTPTGTTHDCMKEEEL